MDATPPDETERRPRGAGRERRDPFATDHLAGRLRARSVQGAAATIGGQGLRTAIQVVTLIVLARFLTSEDFGLVAMVTAVTGFVMLFKDLGLSMATVQRERVTHDQVSTLFWVNVAVSLALMVVTFALAPVVGVFYSEPKAADIMRVYAVVFLAAGLSAQHLALLRRQMRNVAIAGLELAGAFVGAAVAVIAASRGAGYWALVAQLVASQFVVAGACWILAGWVPGRPVRGSGVRAMLGFGGVFSGSKFVAYLSGRVDQLTLGAVAGAGQLGLYVLAWRLLLQPIQQVNLPLTTVVIPALSRLQSDPVRLRRFFLTATALLASISAPIVGATVVVIGDAVPILLEESEFGDVATIFLWLAPGAFLGAVGSVQGWFLTATGRVDRLFVLSGVRAVAMVLAVLFGVRYGAAGVAGALSATAALLRPWALWYVYKGTEVRPLDVAGAMVRPLVATLTAMTAGLLFLRTGAAPSGHVGGVIAGAAVFLVVLAGAWVIIPGGRGELRRYLALRADLGLGGRRGTRPGALEARVSRGRSG